MHLNFEKLVTGMPVSPIVFLCDHTKNDCHRHLPVTVLISYAPSTGTTAANFYVAQASKVRLCFFGKKMETHQWKKDRNAQIQDLLNSNL
jgi:hypothetical protein